MSKPNKANRNNYTQAGRLTPDQMGRERAAREERVKAHANEGRRQRAHSGPESSRPRSAPEE
jgi:hypothetical protein